MYAMHTRMGVGVVLCSRDVFGKQLHLKLDAGRELFTENEHLPEVIDRTVAKRTRGKRGHQRRQPYRASRTAVLPPPTHIQVMHTAQCKKDSYPL